MDADETAAVSKFYGETPYWMQPYQPFMGRWEGLCKTFDPFGEWLHSAAVHMDVYWQNETRSSWHLHEDFEDLYEVGKTVFHTDISVSGRTCAGANPMVRIEGTMLTPYNYVFTIWSEVSKSIVYNNHYFIDANTRRIITHKTRGGQTHIFQIQDFTRVS
jgi:hypothetical protein